jgi:RecB family exonuclease
VRTAVTHGSLVERDLAALDAHVARGGAVGAHPVAALVGRGLAAQAARRSAEFTEWDGNLLGQPIPSTAARPISPSRLEAWAACGFRYFHAHGLGLADRDEPERVLDIGPLDRGSGVHEALEQFLREAIQQGVPAPDQPWSAAQHGRLQAIAEGVFARYEARGRTGRPVHWRLTKATLLATLDDFLFADDEHRARTRSRPERVELPFGLEGAAPVLLTLPDGRALAFRGRADRVDRDEHGKLLVSDYKTGRARRYAGLDEDPVLQGKTLQLGLYAEAALQQLGAPAAEARYWMLDPEKSYPRLGYDWTPDRRQRFLQVVAALVEGIEGGVFAAVPGEWNSWRHTHEQCTYCAFDDVCPRARGEQAQAKVHAPRLRARDALVGQVAE